MAYATTSDVSSRMGRSLSADEVTQAGTLLTDTEILIKARIPDLDDKITDAVLLVEVVKMVEANVVIRFMRNPDGFVSETDGDYTYQRPRELSTGSLEIRDNEWALLGVSDSVFLINLKVPTPFEASTAPAADDPAYWQWTTNSPMFWNPL